MRVLLVNNSARSHTGGANRVVVETAQLLVQAGHETALAYWAEEQPEPGFQAIRVGGHATTPTDELFNAVETFRPDVVQFHSMDNPSLECRIADRWPSCHFLHDQSWFCSGGDRMNSDFEPCHRPHGKECLVAHYAQGCGGLNPIGNMKRWNRVQARQGVNTHPTLRFQVASEFMRRGLRENAIPESRIDLVPLFARAPKAAGKAEQGRLLVASRLVPAKGVECLLQALALLAPQPWHLVICGDGPQKQALQESSAKLGLGGRVEFLGELTPEQLDAEYARCSIVVSPTLRPEPFGLVGPEAMSFGRPIVAFDGGATLEWLRDGETGIAVSERSPAALAVALKRLLDDQALCTKLGQNAKAQRTQFSTERYLESLLRSFERVLSKGSKH